MRARDCSPGFREEFFSETEHILIRCGESSRRRAGSRRIGAEGSRPFAMPRRRRLATCRLLVKPLEPLILICAPCGGVHLNHPKIIRVVTYRTRLLGNLIPRRFVGLASNVPGVN